MDVVDRLVFADGRDWVCSRASGETLEIARVLRPGGTLAVLEHTASPRPLVRAVQGLADPLAGRLEADHLLRRPDALVAAAGLVIDEAERSSLGVTLRLAAHKRGTPMSSA